ncbi:probable ATP-dependent RNA helicase DHX34 isoform X2 [Littorina saxatilis]
MCDATPEPKKRRQKDRSDDSDQGYSKLHKHHKKHKRKKSKHRKHERKDNVDRASDAERDSRKDLTDTTRKQECKHEQEPVKVEKDYKDISGHRTRSPADSDFDRSENVLSVKDEKVSVVLEKQSSHRQEADQYNDTDRDKGNSWDRSKLSKSDRKSDRGRRESRHHGDDDDGSREKSPRDRKGDWRRDKHKSSYRHKESSSSSKDCDRGRDRKRTENTQRTSPKGGRSYHEHSPPSESIKGPVEGTHSFYSEDETDMKSCQSENRSQSARRQGVDGKVEDSPDYAFDYSKHKLSLNRIFFRDQDLIPRGSKEYEDFWTFLTKYRAYQKKKAETEGHGKTKGSDEADAEAMSEPLDIPQKYDRRYRINLCLLTREAEDFIKKGRLVDYEVDKELTRERVRQFRGILLHYLDFCQKQKFQKLKKIRHDQKNLPIYQYKEKIISMIKEHQIVVVAGDTGCGKSTQMPQYLMEAGFEKIACTQPRRIACISLAKRVGHETLNEYGSQVAFQVRFEKTKTASTKILFLTEGLLLRQMSTDQLLSQYSVIVIDEVHERHIFTDFLLGVLKCLLKLRSDLKLVLMSATINISLFSDYFDGAPVIKVPGRLYPIEMEYCPLNKDTELYSGRTAKTDPTPYLRIMKRIDGQYPPTERGDMLVFLSGMTEIMSVVEAARMYGQQTKRWIVLPLHSALSVEEQEKVFDYPPEGVRKCIVSTNIAETSVTIDGVRFVVDSGKVKEMSFDPKYKMQRLKEFWVSRASSEQRKGRAGRTGPGVCFRLYAESDYDEFQAYTTPEIQRVPLDSLVLQLISMGLPNCRKFPFIEPPDMSAIENSVRFLKEQGALEADETLTPIGQMLGMLPVDVVIGKMLIMGSIFHMIDPVMSIAAALSVQSPFTGKAHIDHDAIAARKSLESEHGDPLTLLNAFDEWIQVKAEGRGTKKWCKKRCLEEQRFYEMTKLKRQFRDLLKDHHLLDDGAGDQRPAFTSEERRQRHGERKRLGQLKRDQQQERKRRKVLKVEDEDFAMSDHEEDEQGEDIKDLEFRLTHDLSQLQERSNRSRSFTLRDINLLKVILCSGIFPQVALADDCNSFKGTSEQAFHTKNKPFILLHPTSIFAYQPDLLKPSAEVPEKHSGPTELRGRLSTRHELLAYGSLLETNNKPYLVNCMRVPALQTLTLFTNSIDTNSDCTRLVCDGWLEVRFPDAESAEQVLSAIISLRSTWLHLLQLRLEDTFQGMNEDRETSPRARQLERLLSQKLAEFLDSKVPYALRRIMAAEMQHLYVRPGSKAMLSGGMKMFMKEGDEVKEDPVKGGIQVNAYLTYNCLLDEESASMWGQYTSHMQRHWTCPRCRETMIASVLERLQHENTCQHDDSLAGG